MRYKFIFPFTLEGGMHEGGGRRGTAVAMFFTGPAFCFVIVFIKTNLTVEHVEGLVENKTETFRYICFSYAIRTN